MLEGLRRLYAGEFNHRSTEILEDGTRIITLRKDSEDVSYQFKVKNLYSKNEEVFDHIVIKRGLSPLLKNRLKQAQKEMKKERREANATQSKSK